MQKEVRKNGKVKEENDKKKKGEEKERRKMINVRVKG